MRKLATDANVAVVSTIMPCGDIQTALPAGETAGIRTEPVPQRLDGESFLQGSAWVLNSEPLQPRPGLGI
jgi:hypothetical protein